MTAGPPSETPGGSSAHGTRRPAYQPPGFDDANDSGRERSEVIEWVAVEDGEVRELPQLDPSGIDTEEVGGPGGGCEDGRRLRKPVRGHTPDLLGVFAGAVQGSALVRAHGAAHAGGDCALEAREVVAEDLLCLRHGVGGDASSEAAGRDQVG